tara:strand:- start:32437 stop:33114 length:678 start_codon:yes stop_codon:yes gene_type:complete
MRLLATKLLSTNFKEALIKKGITLIEFPLIKITPIELKNYNVQSNLIFTSQNAVKIAFESDQIKLKIRGKKYFCVGEKTKAILEEMGQKVIKMKENAEDLANCLIKEYNSQSFSFFCGKRRRTEIEFLFIKNKKVLQIHELYDTIFTSKFFKKEFDGILFFSPSAVLSFFAENSWSNYTHGFCIGASTGETLSKFTTNYSLAKHPNENQLLLSINKYYSRFYDKK